MALTGQPDAIGGTEAAEQMKMPSREKYWEECDPEQKIERLREAVTRLCRDVSYMAAAIQRLAAHSHGENGNLLVPIHYADQAANQAISSLAGGGMYAHDHGIPHNLRTKHERR